MHTQQRTGESRTLDKTSKGKNVTSISKSTRRSAMALGLMAATAIMAPMAAQAFDLRVVQGANFDSLDPATTNSTPTQVVLNAIYDGLVKWDGPSMSEIAPDLAESWESSEDGRTWTFKLREDVTFSDGSPFNAEAVKFSLDRIADPALGSANASQLADIESVDVVDEYTVAISTQAPSPTLLERLTESYASMHSPSAVEASGGTY